MPRTKKKPEDATTKDKRLEAEGVPRCPRCGERDRISMYDGEPYCSRCLSFVAAGPMPGKTVPDF